MINNDSYNKHNDNKRKKYVYKVCGKIGYNTHNKLKYKQQE